MFTKPSSKIVALLLIVAIALLTVSFTASPKGSQSYQDYAQRHLGEPVIVTTQSDGLASPDYYQRHSDELKAARPLDTSDYFLRHPELKPTQRVDTTDYYFRHVSR